MVIRKLKLHEWFLRHQLEQIKMKAFHLPIILKIKITELDQFYSNQNKRIPLNALIIKSLGLTAQKIPQMQRMLFKTIFGLRFLEFQEIRINFPIEISTPEQKITTGIAIKNPHIKSLEEIQSEIKTTKQRSLNTFPITKFVYTKNNNWLNRTALRVLYRLLQTSPILYNRLGGGGISFTSLTHIQNEKMVVTPAAYGPTALTFCLNSIERLQNETYLHLGVGYDHYILGGTEMVTILDNFCQNLTSLLPARKNFESAAESSLISDQLCE
jgi:hypothetical protein